MLRLDLASADPPVFFEVSFPGQGGTVRILTGLPGKAVLAASDPAQVSAYGGPENLFVLGTDAAVRDAGSSGSDSPVPLAAASTHSSYPGADVALIGGVHGGACETAQSVMLMDSRTGKTVTTDLSAAQAPGGEPGSTGGLGVHDLWWDRKGRLFAAVEAWTCDHSRQNPRVVAAPPGLWRLEGRRWTKAEDNTMAKVRELRDGTRLVLTSGALGASGTLHEQQPKEEPRVVSSDVLDILAPPL
ncbi:hypothetical protein [Streptomyces sp. NPDC002889]|uniref:hypothetical protein n=1 Tax=Streptomyces sp. NPDC002889 TaxID=3364669 RepID=UPI0036A97DC6